MNCRRMEECFDRMDYGMNKGIPFIKIADHVEVDCHLWTPGLVQKRSAAAQPKEGGGEDGDGW